MRNQKLLILTSSSISKAREVEITIKNTQKNKTWQTTLKNSLKHNKRLYANKKNSRTMRKNKTKHNKEKEELLEIKLKTLRKTARKTSIKVNQLLTKMEIGIRVEDHTEGLEVEITNIIGVALNIIKEAIKLLGEVEVDIVIERKTRNKLKVQKLKLEEDTGVEVLIIIITMATSLEVQEVVGTIKEVKENKKFKNKMMLIIVLMMKILKMMLIILLKKKLILLTEN